MTACIVGWAHSKFGKLESEDIESLIVRVAGDALKDAGLAPADVDAVTLDDAKKAAQKLWGQGLLTVIVGRAPQAAAQPASAAPKAN